MVIPRFWRALLQASRWVIVGLMISILADVYVILPGFVPKILTVVAAIGSLTLLEYMLLEHEAIIEEE